MKPKQTPLEILNQNIDIIQNYFEDNFVRREITNAWESILESISDYQTELELTTTLAEQERNVILEKKHYE